MGGMLEALRTHHDYTFAHSLRVATHLATFALATGMRRDDAEILAQAGLLHDIGKAAVPVGILYKPGPLDSGEWHLVQRHPLTAADVLQRSPELPAHLVRIAERGRQTLPLAAAVVLEVEQEWTEHLGKRRMGQLREILARLREITDPYAQSAR